MTRVLLQYLLPLILPTLVYIAWRYLVGRSASAAALPSLLREGPWFWLIFSGLALVAAGLVATALTGGADPSGTYVPPRWEGGRIVPGRVE